MNDKMINILPIEKNALLRGYSYSSEIAAIAFYSVCFNGPDSKISDFYFCDSTGSHRDYICFQNTDSKSESRVDIQETDDCLDITTENIKTNCKGDAFLYESCEVEYKTCQIRNHFFMQNHVFSFSGVKVFLEDSYGDKEFRAGFISNNKLCITCIDNEINRCEYRTFPNEKEYNFVKIEINKDMFIAYFSADGNTWDLLCSEKNFIPKENRRIGYYLWTDDEHFKDWFFTNHIQLHSSDDLSLKYDVKLDYYCGVKFFDKHYLVNPWIKEEAIDSQLFVDDDCFVAIKKLIDSGYYLGVMLNEKYVTDRWAYNSMDFDHENMIYGYDIKNNLVYICGFDAHQHFSFNTISIDELRQAYNHTNGTYEFKLMKYEVQPYSYTIDKNTVLKMFKEYRDGIDSSYREELKVNASFRKYGIHIYEIMKNNKKQLEDVRVPYIVYEHKKIMTERIKYFLRKGLLNNKDAEKLLEKSKELEKKTYKLILLGIKASIKDIIGIEKKFDDLIDEIYSLDLSFINEFISCLK